MVATEERTAEAFLTAFQALSKKEKETVVEKLLQDKEFMEDVTDIVILEERKTEPSRSLDEYMAERKKKMNA